MYSANHMSESVKKEKITHINYLTCTVLSSLINNISLAYNLKYICLQRLHEWELFSHAIDTSRTI